VFVFSNIQAQQVYTSGAARNVMMGIDLSATVLLDTLADKPFLYALGPVDNLQGEITVIDGKVYAARFENGEIECFESAQLRAPFLAYSYIEKWHSYRVNVRFENLSSIEQVVDSLGEIHGFNEDEAFPFLMEANWQHVDFHVIKRDTTELQHSHEKHNEAKIKFHRNNAEATMLGFFSRHHEGVFTHRGHFTHIHYTRKQPCETGHLDDLKHSGEIIVKLPSK
jgi:acetolactate decarboxylase